MQKCNIFQTHLSGIIKTESKFYIGNTETSNARINIQCTLVIIQLTQVQRKLVNGTLFFYARTLTQSLFRYAFSRLMCVNVYRFHKSMLF